MHLDTINPDVFKFEPKRLERNKDNIKLNDTYKYIDTEKKEAHVNENKIVSTGTNDLLKDKFQYSIDTETPHVLKHDDLLVDNGFNSKIIINAHKLLQLQKKVHLMDGVI
jgi:hypothetical protein